ncbi:hypothetical protein K505DRAFT_365924 [Melanomma pulvis-pyrius CBS 109.77]|uniref:DUF7896 domain-containing protein n=1 Tax=Melanomma pulvis-pyrius CBS 109.77 TaxID=1314802 RepID=A0A6A6WYW9_9PLEO|nr:hypothetical protein K505DRAFT_365924 [Melanomma pulvis-pyrius CBS 109.77]
MKEEPPASTSAGTPSSAPIEPQPTKETVEASPMIDTPTASPTSKGPPKTASRRVLRLKCPTCNEYPDGFRSEHELRRHTNRIHKKARKVWMTIDSSADKTFLADCKACQTGKKYNECYNAASHLRRMHFHPHKRGERKMTASEARRGGKPGDLDPPMEILKANWLREVDEVIREEDGRYPDEKVKTSSTQLQPKPQPQPEPVEVKSEGKAPPTPTTPSTRSMAIESIVDKVDAS